MIIYNVTVRIDKDVEADWLKWMKLLHIPDVMDTGLFVEYKMCRLLTEIEEEPTATTYCVQYFCKSLTDFDTYQTNFAPQLQKEHSKKYDGKYLAFRTVMELVE